MAQVNPINPLDYFKDPSTELPSTYDFNHDGTVDIADYHLACLYMSDDDETNDISMTQAELNDIFKDLIAADAKSNTYDNVNEDTAVGIANVIMHNINEEGLSPTQAKTLNELQDIGKTLTRYIKEAAQISTILGAKIQTLTDELEEIEEEKKTKEDEYNKHTAEVEMKTEELSLKTVEILRTNQTMDAARTERCNNIVKKCVHDYINGEYPNEKLYDVIKEQLSLGSNDFDVTELRRQLNDSDYLGREIKGICGEIDNIVGDIKEITERYNNRTNYLNLITDTRNGVLDAANKASVEYQRGYQVRQDMRQAIVNKYHVAGSGERNSSNNPQVQALARFLNAGELDHMPFADAWAILTHTFDDCGIVYDSATGSLSIPYGHDGTARNIFNALVSAIQRNYGTNTSRNGDPNEADGYQDTGTGTGGSGTAATGAGAVGRNDPISFTYGNMKYDFIEDRDGDNIFDDKSEFLGAKSGWKEMEQYDTNGDGIISGDELKNLKMVATNLENGQFTFIDAASAGITSIDLSSYKKSNSQDLSGDILAGTFKININGETITAVQTEDTDRNIDNKYSTLFGSRIDDLSEDYEKNPFMEEFEETVDTNRTSHSADITVQNTEIESDMAQKSLKNKIEKKVKKGADKAEHEKHQQDKFNKSPDTENINIKNDTQVNEKKKKE